MIEKRLMERFNLELTARVSLRNRAGDAEWINVLTSNICAGGAFLQTRHPFPVGVKVNFEAALPLSEKIPKAKNALIKISGVAIRSEEQGIALRFDDDYEILPLPESVLH
jgi:hypothetical protein